MSWGRRRPSFDYLVGWFGLLRDCEAGLFVLEVCVAQLVVVRAFVPYRVGEFVPAASEAVVLASEHAGHVVAVVVPVAEEG